MKPVYIDESNKRFNEYEENLELYNSQAYYTWAINSKDYFKTFHKNNNKSYINYNFIKLYSQRLTDLILSKGFYIKTDNQELNDWLNTWIEENDYLDLQSKKLQFGIVLGDSPVKLSTRKNYEDKIEIKADYINPDKWYIISDPYNVNIEYGHAIVHDYTIDSKVYHLVEEHYPQTIIYKLFVEDSKDWVQLDISSYEFFSKIFKNLEYVIDNLNYVVSTGASYATIINYKNEISFDSVYSISDFDLSIKSIMYNINDTLTGIHSTNSLTRDPLYSVPNGTIKSILDARKQQRTKKTDGTIRTSNPYKQFTGDIDSSINEYGNEQIDMLYAREYLSELLYKSRAIEKSVDGQSLDIVEHNPQMQNSFEELKTLKATLFQLTSISPILIDQDANTGQLSGTAIRNLAISTLKKASRKTRQLIKSMQKELWTIQELAIEAKLNIPITSPLPVAIEIADGLGTEPADDILWLEKAVNLGLINKQDAIAILRDLPSDEAKIKVKELEDKEQENTKELDNMKNDSNLLEQA